MIPPRRARLLGLTALAFASLASPSGLVACRARGVSDQAPIGSGSAKAAISSSKAKEPPSAAASAAAPPAASASPMLHCKALGSRRSITLTAVPEAEVQLAAAGDEIYALGFTHELARTRLYRFSRHGGPFAVVAEQKGLGERRPFQLAGGAAYYVQAHKLFKLGPAEGAAATLFEGVDSPVAVVGGSVFAVACDDKGKADHLLRIPLAGGPAETVADLPFTSRRRCRYSSLVADEHDVFIADSRGSRIWDVARADRSARVVVSKKGFPGPLILETDALVYSSTSGLLRVPRAGGDATRIADSQVALSPYSLVAASVDAYWVFDAIAYMPTTTLYRIPRGGGLPEAMLILTNDDPKAEVFDGQGLLDFTIDDECVYVAQKRYGHPGAQILAKDLHAPKLGGR